MVVILKFLSCLLGSELLVEQMSGERIFLSCLLGSEPGIDQAISIIIFLSCLLGSELKSPGHSHA